MKALLIVLLSLNFLAESLAAVTLITGPEGIAAAGSGGQWSMHYGFAVIAIISISVWAWVQRREPAALTALLGVLVVFHASVFVSLLLAGDQPAGVLIHAVVGSLSIGAFVLRKRISAAFA